MNTIRNILAGVAAALSLCSAQASYDRNMSPGELALLPPFCQDVQTVNGWEQHVRESPRAALWVSKMGNSFWDMHHYCWARTAVHRSTATGLNQNQRDHLIETALDDMVYVVRRAPSDMVLLPEIFYLMGDYFGKLRRYGQAIEAFKRSRQLKADYWPAYAGHADLLLLSNQKNEARKILQQGLALMPTEVALKSRLERLGGPLSDSKTAGPAKR